MSIYSRFLFLTCLFLGLVSCGKVTQDAKKESENPAFTLNYQATVLPEKDLKTSPDAFKLDQPVYAVVWGITKKGEFTELSWGKHVVQYEEKVITTTKKEKEGDAPVKITEKIKVPKSVSYDKRGIEIESDTSYKWTKGTYKEKENVWDFKSAKIRRTYPHYVVAVYASKDQFKLGYFDQEIVSKNNTVNLGEMKSYDSFLATLHVMQLQKDADVPLNPQVLKQVYSQAYFTFANYFPPPNATERFTVSDPQFTFNRPLEKVLIDLFDVVQVAPNEALLLIDNLDKNMVPTQSRQLLRQNTLQYKALNP